MVMSDLLAEAKWLENCASRIQLLADETTDTSLRNYRDAYARSLTRRAADLKARATLNPSDEDQGQ